MKKNLCRSLQATARLVPKAAFALLRLGRRRGGIVFLQRPGLSYGNLDAVRGAMAMEGIRFATAPDSRWSLEGLRMAAEADVLVCEQASDIAAAVRLRPDTPLVQIWHAGGLYKRMGYGAMRREFDPESERRRVRRIHGQTTHFIASSPALAARCAEEFCLPVENVPALGTPRTDALFRIGREDARSGFSSLAPECAGRRILIYAPTFRTGAGGRSAKPLLDGAKLQSLLGPEWALVFRAHPSAADGTPPPAPWIPCPSASQEFCLAAADALVTDYSSILFDFACLDRPVYLFVPDLKEYRKTQRGLWFEPEDIAGADCTSKSEEELAAQILSGAGSAQRIRERFMPACDGGAAMRAAKFIEKLAAEAARRREGAWA